MRSILLFLCMLLVPSIDANDEEEIKQLLPKPAKPNRKMQGLSASISISLCLLATPVSVFLCCKCTPCEAFEDCPLHKKHVEPWRPKGIEDFTCKNVLHEGLFIMVPCCYKHQELRSEYPPMRMVENDEETV